MAKYQDLIDDIYKLLGNPDTEVSEDALELFGEAVKEHVRDALGGRSKKYKNKQPADKNKLVASRFGLPSRRLWFDTYSPEEHPPQTQLIFLYGNILEELLMLLIREAGHDLQEEQKRIEIDGVSGKKDGRIDGVTVDIKTASNFSFKKFASGEFLLDDKTVDPFGYKYQLGFYMKEYNDTEGAFLVLNKENGELASVVLSRDHDIPDVNLKIEQEKINLERDVPPIEKCYSDEPRGKSGNRVLHRLCTFCPHKFKCWKDENDGKGLIAHDYANERVYFTKLVREPKFMEPKE